MCSASNAGVLEIERHHLLGGDDDGRQVPFHLGVVQGRGALTLQEQLHPAQAALDLTDAGDHARGEENVGRRLLRVVALGDGEDQTVPLECRFDGTQGTRAPRRNRRGDPGEHDSPAKRQDRKSLTLTHEKSRAKGMAPKEWHVSHRPVYAIAAGFATFS